MRTIAPNAPGPVATLLDALRTRSAPMSLWLGRGDVKRSSAAQLREQSAAWAGCLQALGVRPGQVVAFSAPSSLELLVALLGAWQCGAAVAILPEAGTGAGAVAGADSADAARDERVLAGLRQLRPAVLVHAGPVMQNWSPHVACLLALAAGPGKAGLASPRGLDVSPDGIAVMQLTSGSTGDPKVVPLTHRMVVTNCLALGERAAVTSLDHMLSWLPLTHDMGLSAVTVALACDIPLTLMTTELFTRAPLSLLEAMSELRATLSPNPASALEMLARMGRRAQRLGLDLSSWRYAWIGAEPVFARVLAAFEQAMQAMSLPAQTLQPAYGMAEAVVAVSCGAAGRPWRCLHVAPDGLQKQQPVQPCDAGMPGAVALVSSGSLLPDVSARVCDDAGLTLPDGMQGRLWIRGPSVTQCYLHGMEEDSFRHGWFDTGDIGLIWDGELYVTGRAKDLIVRGGVKVGARDVEAAVEGQLELRSGRVAAFASLDHALQRELLVVVVAKRFGASEAALEQRIGQAVVTRCGVRVDHLAFSGAGPLPRTTSGKLRRGAVRALWLQGAFAQGLMEQTDDEVAI